MRGSIKIIISVLLIVVLFTAGCTQQQQEKLATPTVQELDKQVIQEPTKAIIRDFGISTENINRSVDLQSGKLIEIKYLYVPYDINSMRLLEKIEILNEKYGNVVHITKYDITKGISQELKDMGYSGDKGIPSVIINGKLIEPFTDASNRDLDILEAAIKDSIAKRK